MNSFKFAVIFDMDGVVLDTEPLYTRAEIRLFREYSVEIPEEDWPLFRGCAEKDFFKLSGEKTMFYIMKRQFSFKSPLRQYVDIIDQGYKDCNLDREYLKGKLIYYNIELT